MFLVDASTKNTKTPKKNDILYKEHKKPKKTFYKKTQKKTKKRHFIQKTQKQKTTFYTKHPKKTTFYTNFSTEYGFNNTGIVNHVISYVIHSMYLG